MVTTAGVHVPGLVRQSDVDVSIPNGLLDESLGTMRGEGFVLGVRTTAVGSWSGSARFQCTFLGLSRRRGRQHTCPWCFLGFFDAGQCWIEDMVRISTRIGKKKRGPISLGNQSAMAGHLGISTGDNAHFRLGEQVSFYITEVGGT